MPSFGAVLRMTQIAALPTSEDRLTGSDWLRTLRLGRRATASSLKQTNATPGIRDPVVQGPFRKTPSRLALASPMVRQLAKETHVGIVVGETPPRGGASGSNGAATIFTDSKLQMRPNFLRLQTILDTEFEG